MCEPNKDITRVKKALDEFIMKSWYLYSDRDGRLFFKNTKNMIAELNSLVDAGTKVETGKIEKSIDDIRTTFASEGRVNVNLEYNVAKFETGQNFLDWVTEKRKVLKDFKEQEIVQ